MTKVDRISKCKIFLYICRTANYFLRLATKSPQRNQKCVTTEMMFIVR